MTEPTDDAAGRVSYPYLSANVWAKVRARLKVSVPRTLDADWLQSVLGVSPKNAANIVPQFRRLGIINQAGDPQRPLVDDLREDDTYAEAARAIVEKVYPTSLLDAFPDPSSDPAGVESWFRRNAGTGERMAGFQARFFSVLADGRLPETVERPQRAPAKKVSGATKAAPGKRPVARKAAPAPPPGAEGQPEPGTPATPSSPETKAARGLPSVHIDLQIHISPDADAAQVDAIFASLAKHLYARGE